MTKIIQPVIVGCGMSGQAITKSLSIIKHITSEIKLLSPIYAERERPLKNYLSSEARNVLFLANPSGLHAQLIIEGKQSGYDAIICDKPACVRSSEVNDLRKVKGLINILHNYRALWGPQFVRQMINDGDLGKVFSIESRFWQFFIEKHTEKGKKTWKNDLHLNGPFDTFIDLGSHVVDMILYLMNSKPLKTTCWLSYANSPHVNRDTHVHLNMSFSNDVNALASISKTAHGETNNFDFVVFGTKGTAKWCFLNPDEIRYDTKNQSQIIHRNKPYLATGSLPSHGLGWIEGYAEIIFQSLKSMFGLKVTPVPTLAEALDVMECILASKIINRTK